MVTLHFPGVLIEVGNDVSVTIEDTLKGTKSACDGGAGLFICTLGVIITDRVENDVKIVVLFAITKIDVIEKCNGLSAKAVALNTLCHSAYDLAEAPKLLSVCNVKLGIIRIVPAVISLACPSIDLV